MRTEKIFSALIIVIMLSSCAGLLGTSAAASFEKGLAFFNQGKYEEAIPYFQKAVELDPEFSKAYLYLGRSYLSLRKWVEAISPLRTAYRLSPAETQKEMLGILLDALIGAAVSEVKKGNFMGSISYLKEGLELNPEYSQTKNELVRTLLVYGGRLLSEGKTGEAISNFSEALKLSPNNPDAFIGLARSFFKNGDILKAVETIRKAIEIDPGNDAARSLYKDIFR